MLKEHLSSFLKKKKKEERKESKRALLSNVSDKLR